MKFSTPRHSQDLNLGLCWEEFDEEVLVRRNFSASNDPPDLTRRVSLARCGLRLRECPDFLELHVCPHRSYFEACHSASFTRWANTRCIRRAQRRAVQQPRQILFILASKREFSALRGVVPWSRWVEGVGDAAAGLARLVCKSASHLTHNRRPTPAGMIVESLENKICHEPTPPEPFPRRRRSGDCRVIYLVRRPNDSA